MFNKLNSPVAVGRKQVVATQIRREGMPYYAVVSMEDDYNIILRTALSEQVILVMLEEEVRRIQEEYNDDVNFLLDLNGLDDVDITPALPRRPR